MARGNIGLALVVVLSGCALDPVPLDGKRCPCAEGWRCDPATERCVASGADGGRADAGSIDGGGLDAGASADARVPDGGTRDGGPTDAGDPDLLLWLTMDEPPASGTVRDSSVYGHDASCTACPTAAAGRVGGALAFDGAAFLRVPHAATLDRDEYTLAVFIRAASTSGTHRGIVTRAYMPATTRENSLALFHYLMETVRFETFAGTDRVLETTPGVVAIDEWIHLAATVDPAGAKRLYVDGTLVTAEVTEPLVLDASDVLVGADEDEGVVDGFFDGAIDDVRIYGRVLSDSEIAALAAR